MKSGRRRQWRCLHPPETPKPDVIHTDALVGGRMTWGFSGGGYVTGGPQVPEGGHRADTRTLAAAVAFSIWIAAVRDGGGRTEHAVDKRSHLRAQCRQWLSKPSLISHNPR